MRVFFGKNRRWGCHRLFDLIVELYLDLIIELYFDLVLRFILLGCCFCTLPVLRAVWSDLSV